MRNIVSQQRGFSLVEVLVAFVVAAIALLGLAAAQIKALQFATDSLRYTVATVEANNIQERIWPNLCTYQQGNEPGASELLTETAAAGLFHYRLPVDFVFGASPYAAGSTPAPLADYIINVSWDDARQADAEDVNQIMLSASFPWLRNGNPDGCQ